jgi:hypothetical protein
VLTPKELALTAAAEMNDHPAAGNGSTGAIGGPSSSTGQQGGGQGSSGGQQGAPGEGR